jgi:AmmeMemoRadiSam system protein B
MILSFTGLSLLVSLLATSRPTTSAPAVTVPRPDPDSIRAIMAIPSRGDLRGRIDSTGYAFHPEQMAKAWELAALPPAPDTFGTVPARGVAAIVCPHDDFNFAGRVYRRVVPLVTARTVILIGVFHRYYKFNEHDRLIFDSYRRWMSADGPVPVSPLREALIRRLPREDWARDSIAHDAEHSLEPLVCWLRHANPDVEIVPVIVPGAHFDRLERLGEHLGAAIAAELEARGLALGRDVAIAISADGIYYGPDFKQTVFGDGGIAAYDRAVARDRELLQGPLSGPLTTAKIRTLYETFVDPEHPDTYRWTWCGRFSVPLGLLALQRAARDRGGAVGHAVAYSTSIGWPEVGLREVGMSPGSPSNLYHFVGYPGVAFTVGSDRR